MRGIYLPHIYSLIQKLQAGRRGCPKSVFIPGVSCADFMRFIASSSRTRTAKQFLWTMVAVLYTRVKMVMEGLMWTVQHSFHVYGFCKCMFWIFSHEQRAVMQSFVHRTFQGG